MKRSMMCGEVRAEHIGQTVVLQGWVHTVRDHGGLIFVDLRDRAGIVQAVVNPATSSDAFAVASSLHDEYVVEIHGEVERRPAGSENPRLPTGDIEVHAASVIVLNPCLPLPFPVAEEAQVDERVRLQYRYIDLRRPRMARNLILRHTVIKFIRDFLSERGFLEIETPILANPTPAGARDYLLPSRLHPGSFYALPQSPQQFKQLSMVAGVDRYFQIARCFRDEDLRANRQPEFTQLDLEMSFVEQEDVLGVCEALFSKLTESVSDKRVLKKPWPRITWQTAMDRYGSDKPDLRYELPIVDVSDIVAHSPFQAFSGAIERGGVVRGIRAPGAGGSSRNYRLQYRRAGRDLSRPGDIPGAQEHADARARRGFLEYRRHCGGTPLARDPQPYRRQRRHTCLAHRLPCGEADGSRLPALPRRSSPSRQLAWHGFFGKARFALGENGRPDVHAYCSPFLSGA